MRKYEKPHVGHANFEVPLGEMNRNVRDAIECMLWAEAK